MIYVNNMLAGNPAKLKAPTKAVAIFLKMMDEEYKLGFTEKNNSGLIEGFHSEVILAFMDKQKSEQYMINPISQEPISSQNAYKEFRNLFKNTKKRSEDFFGIPEHQYALFLAQEFKKRQRD
jgi:hypothetical protein